MSTIPVTAYPSAPVPSQRPGWFARNWAWFVPCGCATIVVVFVAFICAIVGIAVVSMKSSDIYSMALTKVQSDQQVTRRLGAPIKSGWWVSGNIKVQDSNGTADISFPISGPKRSAKVHAAGTRSDGKWKLQMLRVKFEDTGKSIDLPTEQPPETSLPATDSE